jgi:hypothetical protein
MTTTYRFGSFSPRDAARINGRVVTVSTHPDPEKPSIPAEVYGPAMVHYLSARADRLFLVPADGISTFYDAVIVRLVDVAAVQIHETEEASRGRT